MLLGAWRWLRAHGAVLPRRRSDLSGLDAIGLKRSAWLGGYRRRMGGFSVIVRPSPDRRTTLLQINGLPPQLSVQPEAAGARVTKAVLGDLIEDATLGEPALDDRFLFGGPPAIVYSSLGPEARAGLLEVARGAMDTRAQGGSLFIRLGWWDETGEQLGIALEAAVALARSLTPEGGSTAALLHACQDPLLPVRVGAASALMKASKGGLHAEYARRLMASEDDAVRLEGALASGAAGQPALLAIARSGAPDLRARAVAALEPGLPEARAAACAAMAHEELAVAMAGAALAERLEVAGSQVEGALLSLLSRPEREAELAAIAALAASGTARSVPALTALAEGLMFGPIRREARKAVAAIQARASGERGGLSLAGAASGGEVSMAGEGEQGAVSLPRQRSGQKEA